MEAKGKTAAELMAELAVDPEYQARRKQRAAFRARRLGFLLQAQAPIVSELRSAGLKVESVWDLVNASYPYPEALPILMGHLSRGGYPDRVMEGLGRALAVKSSIAYWDQLKSLYLNARSEPEAQGESVALAAAATPEKLEDLVGFVGTPDLGESRIHFLRPIKRLGGTQGRQILDSVRDDPVLGREASELLGKSSL